MAQIFPRNANRIARFSLLAFILAIPILAGVWILYNQSSGKTGADIVYEQPIAFSHLIHAGRLGLDCRYCHTSVETSSFAGMPSTEQCMTCHSQIVQGLPDIEALAASEQSGTPIAWRQVDNLPDYVYFDHSIHVAKGVACETCHGRVDQMSVVYQVEPMTMDWCLNCHKNPVPYLRPPDAVFAMGWQPNPDQAAPADLVTYMDSIETQRLTDCDVCHR